MTALEASTAVSLQDGVMMERALAFGRRGLGMTAPNPSVGALVVRDDGIVVGRGVTQLGGRPHAETIALADAGALARGATMYVTLEPCSHIGKTGPCADAIIAAGIVRVVSAMQDPDPRVAGHGHARLRAAGVAVSVGVCGMHAGRAHHGHVLRVTKGRPMVSLKLAQTADGFAGALPGAARLMITAQVSNHQTFMHRAMSDCVMVGIGTVLADDPMLTVRLPGMGAWHPVRVVLDTGLRTPLASRLVMSARQLRTVVIGARDAPHEAEVQLQARGVEILRVAGSADKGVDLQGALQELARIGISRILCEGGPGLAAALIGEGLADEVELITSPNAIGQPGLEALNPAARAIIARNYMTLESGRHGDDRYEIFEKVRG